MNYDLRFAEWINNHRIRTLDNFFIIITDTASFLAYAIPVLVLIYAFYKKSKILKVKGLQLLCSILLSTITVTIIKNILQRKRPYEIDHLIQKLSGGGGFSFPSGHTADAFVMATAVTLVLTWKKWLLIPLWIWAFMVAYSRIMLGVHYLSDIAGAMIIGVCCAFIMNFIFKKFNHTGSLHNNQADN
ncbi:MAG TPA: phosphatase PAP2 family protein [Flavisolibacter sp.]|nr:phosphatase PAP2 family protein [Flavisolibacter sp.]